jgi:hypothetical protein
MEGISPISRLADFNFGSASDFAGIGVKFSQRIGEVFVIAHHRSVSLRISTRL